MNQNGRVQERRERGLVARGVARGGADRLPDVVGALVVRRGLPGGGGGEGGRDGGGSGAVVAVAVAGSGRGGPGGPRGRGGGCFEEVWEEKR